MEEGERERVFFAKVGRRWGGFGLVWFGLVVFIVLFSVVVVAVVGFGG